MIEVVTGVMPPQLPSTGSLKILMHASPDLANIHDPALSSRFHRRLSQHQSLPPVLEADFGRGALLDAIDEGADLRIEGLAVALDEEVEIGRGRLGYCGGVAAEFVGLSIAADDHSRRAEQLNPLVVAVDGCPRVIDMALLAARGAENDHCGI